MTEEGVVEEAAVAEVAVVVMVAVGAAVTRAGRVGDSIAIPWSDASMNFFTR